MKKGYESLFAASKTLLISWTSLHPCFGLSRTSLNKKQVIHAENKSHSALSVTNGAAIEAAPEVPTPELGETTASVHSSAHRKAWDLVIQALNDVKILFTLTISTGIPHTR